MRNCCARPYAKRTEIKMKRNPKEVCNGYVGHEGIKTVLVENYNNNNGCDFSSGSDGFCISILTWNMNGEVRNEDIEKLVDGDRRFDLVVIGLQEVPRFDVSRLLHKALAHTHVLLGEAIMQSLQLYVYGPNNSESCIKDVVVDKRSVGGFGGLMRRKKGAVAVRLNYKGIRMAFIACHLSAHARNVQVRNSECRHISHTLFSKNWNPYARPVQLTVWLGDLNYRVQGIDSHAARNLINNDLHGMLTSKDQLLQEAERGQVFHGFCEGTLTFKPTYKYNLGTTSYDTSYKVRVPSWTDRILFKIHDLDEVNVRLHSYESIDSIDSSDHKPVKAHLCFSLKNCVL